MLFRFSSNFWNKHIEGDLKIAAAKEAIKLIKKTLKTISSIFEEFKYILSLYQCAVELKLKRGYETTAVYKVQSFMFHTDQFPFPLMLL